MNKWYNLENNSQKKYGNELNLKSDNKLDGSTNFLSNFDYDFDREKFNERMKAVKYSQHNLVGCLDMFYRTQLTTKGNEYNSGYMYVEPETKNYEKSPGTYEGKDFYIVF